MNPFLVLECLQCLFPNSTGSNEEESRNEVRLIMEHHLPDQMGQPVPVSINSSVSINTSGSENEQPVTSADPADQVSSTTQVSSTSGANQIQVQVAPLIEGQPRSTLPCPAACPRKRVPKNRSQPLASRCTKLALVGV